VRPPPFDERCSPFSQAGITRRPRPGSCVRETPGGCRRTALQAPPPRVHARVSAGALKHDTTPLGFIVHGPLGDTVPDTREPGGDRSFVPLEHPEIGLRAGDPKLYFSPPPAG
jgi:hypothetical protein